MSYSKVDIDNLLALISKGDIEALKAEEFDQFQYQGFDPLKIVQALIKARNDNKTSDEQFMKDVYQMIAIGIIKGSVNDHNLTKMSDDGKKGIDSLIKTYGIQKGGGRGKSAQIITFPRVMATFPDIAVRMVSVIGPKEFSGGPMLSSRLPNYLKVQVFPSIIPRDLNAGVKKMLMTASLCYTIDQSTQISQMKDPDLKQLSSIQGNFTVIGHQSPVPYAETRKAIFRTLNVVNDYKIIVDVLKDYKQKVDPSFDILEESAFKDQLSAFK